MASKDAACGPECCCQVEAVMSVDERGQMVLPKALRTRMGIEAGDKMAAVVMERGGDACCVALVKADTLSGMAREFLGPIMNDLFGEGGDAS